MLSSPNVIATLPKSAFAKGKKVHAAPVHALALGGEDAQRAPLRRRQRSEVVLGLPGGAVQVYDARSARLVSSYNAPPETKFTCAPTSVVIQPQRDRGVKDRKRITVAAIQPVEASKSTKLIIWEESLGKDVSLKDRIKSHQHKVACSTLVKVELTAILGEDGSERPCIIGVEQDGTIRCWNLECKTMTTCPASIEQKRTEAFFLVDLQTAQKGILHNREDIAMEAMANGIEDLVVSILIGEEIDQESRKRKVVVKLHGIHIDDGANTSSIKNPFSVKDFASMELPDSSYVSKNVPNFKLHVASGRLFQQWKKHLAVYRLTEINPILEHEVSLDEQITSMLPISLGNVATISPSSMNVLDVKYRAIIASCGLEPSADLASSPSNGTNGVHHKDKARIDLVSYCPSLELLVAVRDYSELLTIPVESELQNERPRKRLRTSSLADAVGKGLQLHSQAAFADPTISIPADFGTVQRHHSLGEEWQQTVSQLEHAAREAEADAFDTIVQQCPDLTPSQGKSFSPHPQTIDTLLAQIFPIDTSHSRADHQLGISIRLWPVKTIEILAKHGYLTQSRLELAHKRRAAISLVQTLEPSALIKSVSNFDSTLHTLQHLLNTAASFSASHLFIAIKAALHRIQQIESLATTKLLTQDGDTSMQNGTDSEAQEDADASVAREVIESALRRLERTPQRNLHSALASGLLPPDILALIDYLRFSIAEAGWLFYYTGGPEAATQNSDPGTLPFILLNTALDVLGANAWLGGIAQTDLESTSRDPSETLSHMRNEISAALECVEESAYLAGLLHEVLLYARDVPKCVADSLPEVGADASKHSEAGANATAQGDSAKKEKRVVKPVLLASADGNPVDLAEVLPLGLKYQAPQRLEKEQMKKLGADGKMKARSLRDIAHLRSMKVGRHTLERITF